MATFDWDPRYHHNWLVRRSRCKYNALILQNISEACRNYQLGSQVWWSGGVQDVCEEDITKDDSTHTYTLIWLAH